MHEIIGEQDLAAPRTGGMNHYKNPCRQLARMYYGALRRPQGEPIGGTQQPFAVPVQLAHICLPFITTRANQVGQSSSKSQRKLQGCKWKEKTSECRAFQDTTGWQNSGAW